MTLETLVELHIRQDKEFKELQARGSTRRDRRRMAVRHVNEFVRLVKKGVYS